MLEGSRKKKRSLDGIDWGVEGTVPMYTGEFGPNSSSGPMNELWANRTSLRARLAAPSVRSDPHGLFMF